MIDRLDIIKRCSATDAEATLTADRTKDNAASYTDPTTGEIVGLTYGAFIKQTAARGQISPHTSVVGSMTII